MNDLQTAYATQHSGNDGLSEWGVYNTKKEKIYTLPAEWTEKQVMKAIHLGRHFEHKAFNTGIVFQKGKTPQEIIDLRLIIKTLQKEKEFFIKENDKLATEIDKLIFKP